MRLARSFKAAIAAVTLYVTATIAAAPLGSQAPASQIISGSVLANQSMAEACKDSSRPIACENGYVAAQEKKDSGEACSIYRDNGDNDGLDACNRGYQGFLPAGNRPATEGNDKDNSTKDDVSDCGGNAFGWFVCPAMEWIHDTAAFIERKVIEPFLDTPPLSFDRDNDLYQVWQVMRGFANVMFLVAFLVLIIANTLSMNIQAYHVKRMLPRLVIAALAVQGSYFLAAAAIDITNVLGGGIFELIDGVLPEYTGNIGADEAFTLGLTVAIGSVLTMGAAAFSGGIFIVLIGALFGVVLTFLTLVLRQIIITLLVILSPLAFVAWVLPSTEEFFEEWAQLFIRLLLMYPLIMLFFAAGKLFSVAASAAGETYGIGPLFALIGLVAPLFLIPMAFNIAGSLFRGSRNILLRAAGRASKGTADRIRDSKWMEDYKETRLSKRNAALSSMGERYAEWRKNPQSATGFQRFRANHAGAFIGARAAAQGNPQLAGTLARERAVQKQISSTMKEFEDMGIGGDIGALSAIMTADAKALRDRPELRNFAGTEIGIAAAGRQLMKGGFYEDYEKVRQKYNTQLASTNGRSAIANPEFSHVLNERAANRVFGQDLRGEGGKAYPEAPWLSKTGFKADKTMDVDGSLRIRSEIISKTLRSSLGTNMLVGDVPNARQDELFNMRGGTAFHLDPSQIKNALNSPRLVANTTAEGRRTILQAYTGSTAQSRVADATTKRDQAWRDAQALALGSIARQKADDRVRQMNDAIRRYQEIGQYLQTKIDANGEMK